VPGGLTARSASLLLPGRCSPVSPSHSRQCRSRRTFNIIIMLRSCMERVLCGSPPLHQGKKVRRQCPMVWINGNSLDSRGWAASRAVRVPRKTFDGPSAALLASGDLDSVCAITFNGINTWLFRYFPPRPP
jgi:hypothetical protein